MPWTVTSVPTSTRPSPPPDPWISTTPPGCDSPSSIAGPVREGSAEPTEMRGVPPGMSNWMRRSSVCWLASWIAARRVHSGTDEPSIMTVEPVSHDPSPGSSSLPFPVELTVRVSTTRIVFVSTTSSWVAPVMSFATAAASSSNLPTSVATALPDACDTAWTVSCATGNASAVHSSSKTGDDDRTKLSAPRSSMSASSAPSPLTAERSTLMSNSSPSSTNPASSVASAESSASVRRPVPPSGGAVSSVTMSSSPSSSAGSTLAVQLCESFFPIRDAFVVLR